MNGVPCVERLVSGRDNRPGTKIRAPFDRNVVHDLKAEIPVPHRYWDGDAWWVSKEFTDAAVLILFRRWGEIMFIGLDGESDYLLDRHGTVTEQVGLFD